MVWVQSNKGVEAPPWRDIELEQVSRSTVESAWAALECQTHMHEKLKKGKSGGLSEQQYEALLVDVNRYESNSDDVDKSLTVPTVPQYNDDPVIKDKDKFSHIRTAHRSEVPRHLLPTSKDQKSK
ncbi:hypothetical protein PISMIDRAFT_15775 [Pisolithus microcarpus 441]|uniref:Uncharacterized protein n=1 Tax=Pisolithus microcarpus 441 TaxID=765257 RepID=A0A0C9Z2D9_9AGAM|nr:hypothetical protein BKA83DRAFT_15775 [Pisolithus microcarpus]KIK16512.1 hypothetical protein PISMIDRAFT_15775 [Pisolithus microcarpus 441]